MHWKIFAFIFNVNDVSLWIETLDFAEAADTKVEIHLNNEMGNPTRIHTPKDERTLSFFWTGGLHRLKNHKLRMRLWLHKFRELCIVLWIFRGTTFQMAGTFTMADACYIHHLNGCVFFTVMRNFWIIKEPRICTH